MSRRNPNGYGGITKLSGNRKNPYMAYISKIDAHGTITSPEHKKTLKANLEALESMTESKELRAMVIELLENRSAEELKEVCRFLLSQDESKVFKAKQVKKPIGYYPTYKAAQIALAEYNKQPYDLENKKITFAQLWEKVRPTLHLEDKSEQTVYMYDKGFRDCEPIHSMPITQLRTAHLQDVIDQFANMSTSVQKRSLTCMRVVFDYAMRNDIILKDYAQYVKMHDKASKKTRKALTREEVHWLWEHVDYRYRAKGWSKLDGLPMVEVLLVLVYTGLRIDELLNVRCEHIDMDAKYINVYGTKTNNAERLVPIHDKILPIIDRNLSDTPYLFHDNNGNKITYQNLESVVYKPFRQEMDYDHTLHEHRHTFATYSALVMDAKARAFVIGHSQGITDDVYTHPELIADRLRAEVNKIEI